MQISNKLIEQLQIGDFKTIATCLTMVENNLVGAEDLLRALPITSSCTVVGITGPPGAGKSTLMNAILRKLTDQKKRIAILSVDPSSPFNYGALLGDRIRMSEFYLNPLVYIRSVASRGSLGGLNAHIVEMVDIIRSSIFDYLFIETVGVGQSEVDIAGIAETIVVVLVPEAGDEVQTMKAGLMEIADIFVVNKSDRELADVFAKNIKALAHEKANEREIPVIKCIATQQKGIDNLIDAIVTESTLQKQTSTKILSMYTEKAFLLIQKQRMKDIEKVQLQNELSAALLKSDFNIYQFVDAYLRSIQRK